MLAFMTGRELHRLGRRMLGGGLAVAVLVVVAGCTGPAEPRVPPEASTTAPTESAAPAAAPRPTLDGGKVVATGTLAGDVAGTVTITATGDDGFGVRIDDLETELDGTLSAYLSTEPFVPDEYCASRRAGLHGFGDFAPTPTYSFALGGFGHGDSSWPDPGYLDDVVLTRSGAPLEDCFYAVAAVAPLTWTMPDMRPGLVVTDAGSTGGARGDVEVSDGVPIDYAVVDDDRLAEIAARFGITLDDLLYLNPARVVPGDDPALAYVGETLNLDPANR